MARAALAGALIVAAASGCGGASAPTPVTFATGAERAHDFDLRSTTEDAGVVELVALVDGVDVPVATRDRIGPTLEPMASRRLGDVLWVVYRSGGVGLLYVAAAPLTSDVRVPVKWVSGDPQPHAWNWAAVRAGDVPGAVSLHWAMTAESPAHTAGARIVDGTIEFFELEDDAE